MLLMIDTGEQWNSASLTNWEGLNNIILHQLKEDSQIGISNPASGESKPSCIVIWLTSMKVTNINITYLYVNNWWFQVSFDSNDNDTTVIQLEKTIYHQVRSGNNKYTMQNSNIPYKWRILFQPPGSPTQQEEVQNVR